MHWVLQENIFNETRFDELLEVLGRYGQPYSIHKVVPFVGELIPEPEIEDRSVICFGSYSMRRSAKRFGWTPGVYDLEPYDFTEQMKHWGRHMLNADSQIVPFRDVKFEGEMFVRPVHDSKHFTGRVFGAEEFAEWRDRVVILGEDDGSSLRADTVVQVSRPKVIYQEVRCWIVDGRVVTSSVYKRGDWVTYDPIVDRRFTDFASAMVSTMSVDCWNPVRAFVLDVCETPDGLKVVEINTINSAGFYAADLNRLVEALL